MMPLDRGRSLWASHGPSIAGALGAILFLCAGMVDGRAAAAGGIPDNVVLLSNLRYRDGSRACVLDLALPKARADRPRAAVVVIHGGGWIEGDKSSFDVQRTPGNIIDFAAAGFVAASVNYRLSREAPFPAGLYDCQAAVRWLRATRESITSTRTASEPTETRPEAIWHSCWDCSGLRAAWTNGADRFSRKRAESRPSSATAVPSISSRSTRMARSAR